MKVKLEFSVLDHWTMCHPGYDLVPIMDLTSYSQCPYAKVPANALDVHSQTSHLCESSDGRKCYMVHLYSPDGRWIWAEAVRMCSEKHEQI